MENIRIDDISIKRLQLLGFESELNWFEIEKWLWKKYRINIRTNIADVVGNKSGWVAQLGLLGQRDQQLHFHQHIKEVHHDDPITAKVDSLKKCISYLYTITQEVTAMQN